MTGLAGYQADISLPHEQEFELYHNAFSLCSMKVRVCMAELGLPYRSHHIDLIETGCYENVRPAFRQVNPGCTVPLLVHKGHPIYESDEQILYAAAQSASGDASLLPESASEQAEMGRWIELASLTGDPIKDSDRSAGNAVPGLTLPVFTAMIEKVPYLNIFEGFLRHFDKRRPLMFTLMKLNGFQALHRVPMLGKALADARQSMHTHLDTLEHHLHRSAGHWILGESFSLADVAWLAIFERLRQADSLQLFIDDGRRPACAAYWERLIKRPSYEQAIVQQSHPLIDYAKGRIRKVKSEDDAMRKILEGAD